MHGIFYDAIHDEIVVPVALAGAILTLPGDASGDAPPKRILQGAKTGIVQPDTLYVDLQHDEVIVESGDRAVLIFPRAAEGDVAPSRRIGGAKSQVDNIYGLAADAKRNLIVVANREESGGRESNDSILIFNRLDNGDVAPRAKIAGQQLIGGAAHFVAAQVRGGLRVAIRQHVRRGVLADNSLTLVDG